MASKNNENLNLNNKKKIIELLSKRKNTKNKKKPDILPTNILIELYENFINSILTILSIEEEIGNYIGRIPNFPETISENIVLYVLKKIKQEKCTWRCKGDILVGKNNTPGEVKCHFNGPTQFSPNKKKDGHILFYLEAEEHISCGYFKLYQIDNYNNDLKKVKINKYNLLEDQQNSGRRPRFELKKVWPNLEKYLIWEGTIYDLLK